MLSSYDFFFFNIPFFIITSNIFMIHFHAFPSRLLSYFLFSFLISFTPCLQFLYYHFLFFSVFFSVVFILLTFNYLSYLFFISHSLIIPTFYFHLFSLSCFSPSFILLACYSLLSVFPLSFFFSFTSHFQFFYIIGYSLPAFTFMFLSVAFILPARCSLLCKVLFTCASFTLGR